MMSEKSYDNDYYRTILLEKCITPRVLPQKGSYCPQILTKIFIVSVTKSRKCSATLGLKARVYPL
jgi:hypothetical protein